MIKEWLVTGDTHGGLSRFKVLQLFEPETAALIVLGDVGFNYLRDRQDERLKFKACQNKNYIYCVRGNHEMRPQDVPTMEKYFDENVGNFVYYEPKYPFIRYLLDGHCYDIGGYKTLVIGGAYSVDKYYRLEQGRKWFSNEQLTEQEMNTIYDLYKGDEFDIILSHTCPLSWCPTDLFLPWVDSSTVDKSMEIWMDKFKDVVKYNLWLFGHYHNDRFVRPHVEMLFQCTHSIGDIYNRWNVKKDIPCGSFDPKFNTNDNQWFKKEE